MAKTKNMKGKHAAKGPLRKAPYVKPDPTKPKDERHRPAKKEAKRLQRPTIPFVPEEDRILLVGEGDFSFAKSIVEHHGCCDVTATCYDGQAELFEKYKPQAEEHINYLEEEGQTVLYNIDATKIGENKALSKSGLYNHILFNFPHVGGKSTDVNRQVRFNQETSRSRWHDRSDALRRRALHSLEHPRPSPTQRAGGAAELPVPSERVPGLQPCQDSG
jgi:25S rRNA (uracil2634-N3)-methyltransferase